MVADALDHCQGSAIAHAEALAGHPPEVGLSAGGAVEGDVADEGVLLRHEGRARRWQCHDPPTGQALADVVIGVALEYQGDTAGDERPEALARRALKAQRDCVVGESFRSIPPRDLAAQESAHDSVHIADGEGGLNGLAALQRGLA